ncbi:MAG: cytochrome c3 family protein [Planctomycetota bacterium]|jgi:predicted CXXCH cytochrome family protein
MALKPAASLDRRIRLFDNRVGCGSCHSPFADDEALLVMSNLRSRLCLSCHEL